MAQIRRNVIYNGGRAPGPSGLPVLGTALAPHWAKPGMHRRRHPVANRSCPDHRGRCTRPAAFPRGDHHAKPTIVPAPQCTCSSPRRPSARPRRRRRQRRRRRSRMAAAAARSPRRLLPHKRPNSRVLAGLSVMLGGAFLQQRAAWRQLCPPLICCPLPFIASVPQSLLLSDGSDPLIKQLHPPSGQTSKGRVC